MRRPRVLFVTRRFWPFSDDACLRLLYQTEVMKRSDMDITVLTARWHSSWPEFFLCREVPVFRLLPGPNNHWNENHFQKNCLAWITKHLANFDCIYVDRSDSLLSSITSKASKWKVPVIARFAPDDTGFGLCNGLKINQLAMAEHCRRCSYVVCSSPKAHRLLISQGISEPKIVRIPDCDWDRSSGISSATSEQKTAASNALFEMSSDFVAPARTAVVVHLGISEAKPLRAVIKSVCDLLEAGGLVRMWIIGHGLPPNMLHDLIKSRGWHREILLFDSFDDLQELVQVADLAIISNPEETLQYTLPLIAQASLPAIISDCSGTRAWLPSSHHSQLYSSDLMFDEKLNDWFSHRASWQNLAATLRQSLRRIGSAEESAQKWLSLFRESCIDPTP